MISLTKPIAISSFSRRYVISMIAAILLLLIIGVLLIWLSVSHKPFLNLTPIICGYAVYVVLAILSIMLVKDLHEIKVYKDYFERKNSITRIKQTFYFSEFDRYYIRKINYKITDDFEEIHLLGKNKELVFKSIYYEELNQTISHILQKKKNIGKESVLRKTQKERNIINILLGVFVLYALGVVLFYVKKPEDKKLSYNDFVMVSGTISDLNIIKESKKGSRTHYQLEIKLNEYPEFDFTINDSYDSINVDFFLSKKMPPDSLNLFIPRYLYQKKIERSIPINFWAKYTRWEYIEVCGVSDEEYYYLNPETCIYYYSEEKGLTKNLPMFSINFVIILISIGVLYSKPEKKTNV